MNAVGNLSVRLKNGTILVTASGLCKGRPGKNFASVTPNGVILSGPRLARDIWMHLAAYRAQPEVRAVVPAKHGAMMLGDSVEDARNKMEMLELFWRASAVSRIMGRTRFLNRKQYDMVMRLIHGEPPDQIAPLGARGL